MLARLQQSYHQEVPIGVLGGLGATLALPRLVIAIGEPLTVETLRYLMIKEDMQTRLGRVGAMLGDTSTVTQGPPGPKKAIASH